MEVAERVLNLVEKPARAAEMGRQVWRHVDERFSLPRITLCLAGIFTRAL